MFFESSVEVSVGSSDMKFVGVGACQFINPYLLYCSILFEIMLFSLLFVLYTIFIFLSIFLIVLAIVDSLPVYVSVIHLLDSFVSISDSTVILFCLDFCFLVSLWIVFRLNSF